MDTLPSSLTDADLIRRCSEGLLIHDLLAEPDTERLDFLRNRTIALHNSGQLNLLAIMATNSFDDLPMHRFFSLQQVFIRAIPELDAPLDQMMAAVNRLIAKGGGAASFPFDAFRIWLGRDPARARAVITATRSEDGSDRWSVAAALEALSDIPSAKTMLALGGDARLAALSALGRIKPTDQTEAEDVLGALLPYARSENDDVTRFAAVFAAIAVMQAFDGLADHWIARFVTAISNAPTNFTRTALLQGLWRTSHIFDASNAKAVLKLSGDGDLADDRLAGMLEATLAHLVDTCHRDLALDCLTRVLAPDKSLITLEKWQALRHRFANGDRRELFELAVRWLSTGNPPLCEAIAHIVGTTGNPVPFDGSLDGFGMTPSQQVVLCHKAIAYLFIHSAVAASIVVAALRAGDKTIEAELADLLFFPILINFRGKASDYLRGIPQGDGAYRMVRQALKRQKDYLARAQIEKPVKELWPSAYQRNIADLKRRDTGRQIRKLAEQQSVFFNLIHHSTILYGRKSLTYVAGPDKPPVTLDLKTFSHFWEPPQLDTIDPVGLDYLLRIFKASSPK